jgi:hypothetical protein
MAASLSGLLITSYSTKMLETAKTIRIPLNYSGDILKVVFEGNPVINLKVSAASHNAAFRQAVLSQVEKFPGPYIFLKSPYMIKRVQQRAASFILRPQSF